eukprot:jgi/Bigna1/85653/estExt_fgenesh1_pg.C_50132
MSPIESRPPTSDTTSHPTTSPDTTSAIPYSSRVPTGRPTYTMHPTRSPHSLSPSTASLNPTQSPSLNPTQSPSLNPTQNPSLNPTQSPSPNPTQSPSLSPTAADSSAFGTADQGKVDYISRTVVVLLLVSLGLVVVGMYSFRQTPGENRSNDIGGFGPVDMMEDQEMQVMERRGGDDMDALGGDETDPELDSKATHRSHQQNDNQDDGDDLGRKKKQPEKKKKKKKKKDKKKKKKKKRSIQVQVLDDEEDEDMEMQQPDAELISLEAAFGQSNEAVDLSRMTSPPQSNNSPFVLPGPDEDDQGVEEKGNQRPAEGNDPTFFDLVCFVTECTQNEQKII